MGQAFKTYLRIYGPISMFFMLFSACRPDPILPPGPQNINVEATVPNRIYTNIKKVILDGSATSSLNELRTLYFSWACISFPLASGSPEIKFKELPTAFVENLAMGEYKFQLTVKDNLGNINISTYPLKVIEDTILGKSPIAKAGPDQQITAPQHHVELNGFETIPNNSWGRPLEFRWNVIQQPAGNAPVKFSNDRSVIAIADNLEAGLYKFQLEVKNEYGLTAYDTLEVSILPDPLKGSTKIFEDVKWYLEGSEDWGYYISLLLKEPDLFINRSHVNMEVRIWDEDKKDWSDLIEGWNTSTSGELYIWSHWRGDMESYHRMDGVKTKVKVTMK